MCRIKSAVKIPHSVGSGQQFHDVILSFENWPDVSVNHYSTLDNALKTFFYVHVTELIHNLLCQGPNLAEQASGFGGAGLRARSRIPACHAVRPYCPYTEGWDGPAWNRGAGAEEPCLEPAWWQYGPHGACRGQVTQKPRTSVCMCVQGHVRICERGRERRELVVWWGDKE